MTQPGEPGRDEDWFAALYTCHHGRVLAYARRRTHDPDDVVAEVFATAWRHRTKLPDDPVPWLLRTASHQVLHALRAGQRRERLARRAGGQASVAGQDHADQVAARHDAGQLITAAMAQLSPSDQEVLRLAAWEELSTTDIAYVLSCTEVSARVRLHRAKRRLAQLVDVQTSGRSVIGPLVPTTCEVQP